MKKIISIVASSLLMAGQMHAQISDVPMEEGRYANNWESLKQWECPEWFKDAKFGLWAHWGPQCQAESGDWYARFMYYNSNPYDQHRGTNFNPGEYGLKEFCRDWKAERWDPKAIMAKYKAVGCRYFMALGNHHDNFDLWDSPYQEWNSVNIGPKRDLGAEWAEAAREQGLKFGVSIHASHAWTWLEPSQKYDGNLTKADGTGTWWEGYDPQELYAQNHPHSEGWENSGTIHSQWEWGNGASLPSEAYKTKLQNRCRQMVNALNPDIIYFDDTVLPFWGCDPQWGPDFLAHYYNHASNLNGGGDAQVVVTGKILPDEQKEAMMWDVERGIPDRPREEYWQTCTCIGDWHYNLNTYRKNGYKSAATVVRMLVDIVSKNGNLLLSIPLRADGTYDDKEEVVLNGIEAWMKINGESIYGTRVWKECFGEGPLAEAVNSMTAQGFNEGQNYTSADVRYVTKQDLIYATIMAWPSAGQYVMKAFSPLATSYHGEVEKVELLGYGEVGFTHDGKGLTLDIPSTRPNDIAPVFRISFKKEGKDNLVLLNEAISTIEALCNELSLSASPVNSGKYNSAKLSVLEETVAELKNADTSSEEAIDAALKELRESYQDFLKTGLNEGGLLTEPIAANLTGATLVEGENFSGTLGGRYGKLDNWIVENYNIPNSSGDRQGLDNYNNVRGISLGVWNDKGDNNGDLTNARIYRKVVLKPGKYFFGAAYNSIYGCNDKAYMFVSDQLCSTDEIPSSSLAYYQVNKSKEGDDLYGLKVEIKEEKEYYIGWQANMDNGSATQEFRAVKVAFLQLEENNDNRPIAEKLSEAGWTKLEGMTEGFDYSKYFFALVDHSHALPVAARSAAGDKNWSGTNAMQYVANANPNTDAGAVWVIEAFNTDGNVATGTEVDYFILSSMKDQNRHFRTEGWSKVVWQTYSDFGKNGMANDGNRSIAYLLPEYSATEGWTFKNLTSNNYVGPWDDGAFVDGAEFSVAETKDNAAHVDIYALPRSQWMRQFERIDEVTDQSAIDITYLITNNSFERYDENLHPLGWTVEGGGVVERGYLAGCDGQLYVNNWQSSGKLSDRRIEQTLSQMPAGKYRLSVFSLCGSEGAYLYANTESIGLKHNGNDTMTLDFSLHNDSDITIGVRLEDYQGNDFKFDRMVLRYCGQDNSTGMETIEDKETSSIMIFDLQGRRHNSIQKGINIVRKGTKTQKYLK